MAPLSVPLGMQASPIYPKILMPRSGSNFGKPSRSSSWVENSIFSVLALFSMLDSSPDIFQNICGKKPRGGMTKGSQSIRYSSVCNTFFKNKNSIDSECLQNDEDDENKKIIQIRATTCDQRGKRLIVNSGGRNLVIGVSTSKLSLSCILDDLKKSYPEYVDYALYTKNNLEIESNSITESIAFWNKIRGEILYMPRRGLEKRKKIKICNILQSIFQSVEEETK
jgi:hypothetical protein